MRYPVAGYPAGNGRVRMEKAMNMVSLDDMLLFTRVVELESFTAAAEQLGMAKSSISRRLRAMEDQLAVRLLERTTRSIQLTDVGELYYQRCIQTLNEVEETRQLVTEASTSPTGLLRIYAPNEFCRRIFQELIPQFCAAHPELKLDIRSGTMGQHLLDDRYDVMIHIDNPEDSSFIARPLATVPTNYYASPSYIERRGEPRQPEDLLEHDCVLEVRNRTSQGCVWHFPEADGHIMALDLEGKYISDSTSLSRAMVMAGMGIAMLPDYICQDAVAAGKLIKVFGGRYQMPHTIYALHPSRRYPPYRVKVFLDFMARELQGTFEALSN